MKKLFSILASAIMLISGIIIPASAASDLPFTDVDKDDWFYSAVAEGYKRNVMNGLNEKTYAPNQPMTRAMFVHALANHSTTYSYGYTGKSKFSDVDPEEWYYHSVQWAADLKIIEGYNGKFNPSGVLTRADASKILHTYAMRCSADVKYDKDFDETFEPYTDTENIPDYAVDHLWWAISNGVIEGTSKTLIDPMGYLTRAQAATVFTRIMDYQDPLEFNKTYRYDLELNGERLLSMNLPEMYKDDCLIEVSEDTARDSIRAVFYSKKNHVMLEGMNVKTGGHLFSILIQPENTSMELPSAREIGIINRNSNNYKVYIALPTDVQWTVDEANYKEMEKYIIFIEDSIQFEEAEETIKINGQDIFTAVMPTLWVNKYIVERGVNDNGNEEMRFYEKMTHESMQQPLDLDGWLFTIELIPASEPVSGQHKIFAEFTISGQSYHATVMRVSDIRYDPENQTTKEAYMALLNTMSIPVNNGFFADGVTVTKRYQVNL